MTLAEELAARITAFSYESLPPEAVHWAKIGVIDTLGVALAGADEECARIVRRLIPGSSGPSLLLGSADTAAPLDAALVNGTAAHALDFDDCSDSLGGHPSAPILPALFALADTHPRSGRAFLTAYVAGFETETRIARAVQFHHYEKGWHPTATLGTFGAAAAAAHFLGLDAEKTALALALAASFASGIKANFGTMTKPLHVGHAARNGLFAALLAREGFTAAPEAFEHRQGFFQVFNGEGNYDAARVLENWAAPLDILRPGIAIKQYPCCGSTHPAIDIMIALRERHGLTPKKVARVESWTHPRRLAHTNRPAPRSALEAKFSVQYCLARALAAGRVVLGDFAGDAWRAPANRAIMARIEAAPHPEMTMATTQHFGAELHVHLHGGETLALATDRPLGRGPDKPLPLPLLEAKFVDCATHALAEPRARRLLALLWRLDEQENFSLRASLAAGPAAQAAE